MTSLEARLQEGRRRNVLRKQEVTSRWPVNIQRLIFQELTVAVERQERNTSTLGVEEKDLEHQVVWSSGTRKSADKDIATEASEASRTFALKSQADDALKRGVQISSFEQKTSSVPVCSRALLRTW